MRVNSLNKPIIAELEKIASDKSISHRCAIFSLLSDEKSTIYNYLDAQDTMDTLKMITQLGAKVDFEDSSKLVITPPKKITSPDSVLYCGNSGTSMRILLGLLSACEGFFIINGDEFLNKRPMKRISKPLQEVGAKIYGREGANLAPLAIEGAKLEFFEYESKVASAQVKTALILSALLSKGCKFSEPELSRDHSENMLKKMGAKISNDGLKISVEPLKNRLEPLNLTVPNDPSSCFFYAVAACIVPGSKILLKNVLLNKTRIEAYKILKKMGAKISYTLTSNSYEEIGDICVEYSELKGVEISENIAWLIDEIPALAIACACAKGRSVIKNAKELRVKECDRISVMVQGLKECGILVEEFEDGFAVTGSKAKEATIDSKGDHRIAMSFAILGLLCSMNITNSQYIATSFPNFSAILKELGAKIED